MNKLQEIDFSILDFIYKKLKFPFLDNVMPFISSLADNGFIWIAITVTLLLTKKQKKSGITLSLALIINAIICNLIMKPLFQRTRPFNINTAVSLLISPPKDYSFPSGHTSASFAAAVVIYSVNKKLGTGAFVLATAIGFSRMYLYVHFPSDVIVGAILGTFCGLTSVVLIKKYYNKENVL